MGLIAKRADQGKLITFVTDLKTTQPMSGVDVEIYDYQQQLIGTGKTDAEGKYVLEPERRPFFMVTKSGGQFGYLKLDDGSPCP